VKNNADSYGSFIPILQGGGQRNMEARSSVKSEKPNGERKLENLPESEDRKFWKGDTQIIRLQKAKRCKHEFERLNGIEVRCKKCHMGYRLGPEFSLQDGHIYYKSKKLI